MRPPPPSRAFLGQAISASRSSSPTSSATPSWVNTPHPPPFLLPSLRDTLLTLTPLRSLCSDVSLTFPALLHLQVWLHCPPSPPARSLCAPSTPPQLRPPLSPALGSPSWPSPWTSRSLLAAWAPERSSEASRASSARPRRGSHSCAITCCPRRAPGLEPLAVGGGSREQVPESPLPRTRTAGPRVQVRLRPGRRASRRPGPQKPLLLAFGACDALVASQHGPWKASNTLRLSPDQEGLRPGRGALRRMADAGTQEKVAPWLGVGRTWRGGADTAQARRTGTWLGSLHLAPPPAHGRRSGWH